MVVPVDFKDIRVGDRVMIVSEWVEDEDGLENWNHEGYMDHHLGTIMTVRGFYSDGKLEMEEDKNEFDNGGWVWFPEMIAGLWVEEALDEDTSEWAQETLCSLFE